MKASQIVALDDFALQAARGLSERMPRCDNTIPQLPSTTPVLTDIAVISRPQPIPGGGYDYGVSLAQLQALIGGGGGIPSIEFNTNLSALTVYNYGNAVNVPNASATVNTTALQSMFDAMQGASGLGGGWAWIPQYGFSVNASGSGINVLGSNGGGNPGGIVIQGMGGGGQSGSNKAFTFSINDTSEAGVFLNFQGAHTSGGSWLKNIAFQWLNPNTTYDSDTCLNVNVWNFVAEGCTFTDCPVAANFMGLSAWMSKCTIDYGITGTDPVNNTAILIQGQQTEISGPSEFNGHNLGGNSTCIGIGGGTANSNHCTFRNLHIFGWTYCIDWADTNSLLNNHSGTQNTLIDGCHFEGAGTCLNITPYQSGGQLLNQSITNCLITKGQDSTSALPIVYIDSNSGSATNIGPILFVNNVIYSDVTSAGGHTGVAQADQYGVQIGLCEYVGIIGGQISQVGTNGGSDGTANVCISGDAVRVVIDGVNLSPTYAGANGGSSTGSDGSAASEYGLLISGNPVSVNVTGCTGIGVVSITGNPTVVTLDSCNGLTELSVTGSPTTLTATNCAGYNDQNKNIVGNGTIATGTAYTAATAGTVLGGTAINYFGPSFLMFTANSSGGTVAINGGTPQTLVDSQIVCLYLNSPYDSIEFATHAPSALQWLGK